MLISFIISPQIKGKLVRGRCNSRVPVIDKLGETDPYFRLSVNQVRRSSKWISRTKAIEG